MAYSRVDVTDKAKEVIDKLRAEHGALIFIRVADVVTGLHRCVLPKVRCFWEAGISRSVKFTDVHTINF
jgi:uncharacterized protein (DUF779 family)